MKLFATRSNAIQQFKIIQKTENKLLIQIVKKNEYSEGNEKEILLALQKKTGPEMEIEFDYVDEIKSLGAKPKIVESNFNPKF